MAIFSLATNQSNKALMDEIVSCIVTSHTQFGTEGAAFLPFVALIVLPLINT